MSDQNRLSKFWHELKRRKVIQVIIIYAPIAFIVIQLVDILEDDLNLPKSTMLLVIILLVVGLIIAVVFSWIFDVSSKGISVTEAKKVPHVESITQVPEKSIIVLPFDNISSDPEQEYFSDGLTEEIITDLSYISELLVISRSSAMTFKGSKKKIKEIAADVNVRYVLEGSVRKSGNNLRIVAQLIDAQTDIHLWAEKYTGKLDDIFDIQEKVSKSIAGKLKLKLDIQSSSIYNIQDIEVFEAHYRAVNDVFSFSEPKIQKAIRELDDAIVRIGNHALLYTTKGWAMWFLVSSGFKPRSYLFEAKKVVQQALKIAPDSARSYAVLGWIEMLIDMKKSVAYYKKALSMDPHDSFALQGIIIISSSIGKKQQSIEYLNRLQRIDPLHYLTRWLRAAIHFYAGEFKQSFHEWYNLHKSFPTYASTNFFVALSMLYFEPKSKVIDFINQTIDFTSKQYYDSLLRMLLCVLENKITQFYVELDDDFIENNKYDYTITHHLAVFFSMIGKKDESLNWLSLAVDSGFINYPMIAEKDTLLENIRGEKKFAEIMSNAKQEWKNFEI